MNLSLIVERLKEHCPLLDGQVFLAIQLASTEPSAISPPCAFVVPLSEKNNGEGNLSLQKMLVQFAVVTVVKNVSDVRGEESYYELIALREAVKSALIRFHHPDNSSPIRFSAGTLNYFDDLIVSWIDRFEFDVGEIR